MLVALLLAASGRLATAQDDPRYSPERDCLESGAMPAYLERAFAESRVASGETRTGHAMELFASERGTWTMVELLPEGQSCVAASGTRLKLEQPRRTG